MTLSVFPVGIWLEFSTTSPWLVTGTGNVSSPSHTRRLDLCCLETRLLVAMYCAQLLQRRCFSFTWPWFQLGETHRPDAWLPFAAIPHRDFSRVKGGLSKCLASVLASLKAQLLTKGLVRGVPFEFQIHGFLADYDGFRACFLAKGASALKPCFLCQNVVMKNSDVVMSDPILQNNLQF